MRLLSILMIVALAGFCATRYLVNQDAAVLESAARSLGAGLRLARNRALNDNRPATFLLDTVKRVFRVPGERRQHLLPSGITIASHTMRAERLDERRGAIRFFPDGTSTGGRIALYTDRMRYLVSVDWLTGEVGVIASVVEEAVGR